MIRRARTVQRQLRHRVFQWLHAAYYRFVFRRKIPFGTALDEWIYERERPNTVPDTADVWNTEYRTGRWRCLDGADELGRYMTLAGYVALFKPMGTVLDVGCGTGLLFERYQPYGYTKYVGLDLSETALAKLISYQDEQTVFLQADAETYQPTESYDVIVFNEILYYLHDPLRVVARYAQALKPRGLLIISTYVNSGRAMAILHRLKASYTVVDETRIRNGAKSWLCTVLEMTHRSAKQLSAWIIAVIHATDAAFYVSPIA
jgi:SAM-dependent methyltransferase